MTSRVQQAKSQWLDIVLDVLGSFTPTFPWEAVCRELGEQVASPVSGDFGWGVDGRGGVVRAYPMPDWFDLADVAGRAPQVHPLAVQYAATGESVVLTLDDVPPVRCPVEREYLAEMREDGIDQHMWIPVDLRRSGPCIVGVCRSGTAYTAQERELGRLAQSVLVPLHRHVTALGDDPAGETADRATALRLTPRQVSVLRLAAAGLTSTAIGRRLAISPRTAEHHLEAAYARLGTHDRVTAIRIAEASGLVPRLVRPPSLPLGSGGAAERAAR